MKFLLIFLLLTYIAEAGEPVTSIFPTPENMPGGTEHWVSAVLPMEEGGACEVYTSTYAYFTAVARPILGIPRNNVYSVSIRLHVCPDPKTAGDLYTRFAAIGELERRKSVAIGERGTMFVMPSPESEFMGEYYITSLFNYIVMQIHADDGFAAMDIADMMAKRVAEYVSKYPESSVKHKSQTRPALAIESGHYAALIQYQSGRTAADVWRLNVGDDGKIHGSTMNAADGTRLTVTGTLDGDKLTVIRPCGTSILGRCEQKFEAVRRGDIFEGLWSGTGGGGLWKIYVNSFEDKETFVSLPKAGFTFTPEGVKGVYKLGTGKDKRDIVITPPAKGNDDFMFRRARFVLDIKANKTNSRTYLVYIYGIDGENERLVATSNLVPVLREKSRAYIDVTNIYRNAIYPKYILRIGNVVGDQIMEVVPQVELTFAAGTPKSANIGAVAGEFRPDIQKDFASNLKAVRPDGNIDLAIALTLKTFGETLQSVSIAARGDERRSWNTIGGNIFPSVAVADADDNVLNSADGSVIYTVQKMEETLYLYFSKGSMDMSRVDGFDVTLVMGGKERVVYVESK